jgi:hypothetical protein
MLRAGSLLLTIAIATPVMAQDTAKAEAPKAVTKVLLENDKVRVYETTFPPGAEASDSVRPYRITRALTDGTLLRIYADGRTDTMQWKAGEVKELGPDPQYKPRNVGKSEFTIYVVQPKSK